jgi:hypothetical protein
MAEAKELVAPRAPALAQSPAALPAPNSFGAMRQQPTACRLICRPFLIPAFPIRRAGMPRLRIGRDHTPGDADRGRPGLCDLSLPAFAQAIAALYTEGGWLSNLRWTATGRESIQQNFGEVFRRGLFSNGQVQTEQVQSAGDSTVWVSGHGAPTYSNRWRKVRIYRAGGSRGTGSLSPKVEAAKGRFAPMS